MRAVIIVNLDVERLEKIKDNCDLNSLEETVMQEMNWTKESGIYAKEVFIKEE